MNNGTLIGVCVVAAIIGVGAAYVILNDSNEADIRINVSSPNFINDLDVLIYVDGKLVGHGTMKASPLGSAVYIDHKVKFNGDSKTVKIEAISQGGTWGTVKDTKTLIVVNGNSYTVNLVV